MMRVILAAGGTAGHINPALAIADKIAETVPDSDILFVGTPTGLEAKLVTRAEYAFAPIKAAGLQRGFTPRKIARNAKAAYYFITAARTAKRLIQNFNPDVVIGTGGYVTAPVLRTAAKLGYKTVTHESNSLPGVATKMLAKTADRVFVADEDAVKRLPPSENRKYTVTGNPLRGVFRAENRGDALASLGLPAGMTVLSFGGSLGANRITEAVIRLLSWENGKGDVNHIHAYGGNGKAVFDKLLTDNGVVLNPERTIVAEYIHNMYTCMAAADLVISRSGSMTLTELKAFGRASIQIPWAGAAENHQYYNALTMSERNAAILIKDAELTGEILTRTVEKLYNNRILIREMEGNAAKMASPNAADVIVREIIELVNNG
ncbi:MAG: UDP-N-acetylglucosamine--N-acetylmuramyl-(pentapeptide) pyrophosphoryl-undecaprenol N-acetylglucosamine transferase [Oscillospiraceae bacterium]|jgi:UDP-N-acetylglucosamine--N-acetylmuramyl-(pentapeptide) pyrophosphoryl-undecaprenol N-acetylglucosamine transferase|nr:UDP-N-acetylglucosamine--N-acetylmuramyl-(pentapeptide) pyrophosphoryl-undecaprenol N-acetylglucosamine transferase [Oscillospiraceae bacterium]